MIFEKKIKMRGKREFFVRGMRGMNEKYNARNSGPRFSWARLGPEGKSGRHHHEKMEIYRYKACPKNCDLFWNQKIRPSRLGFFPVFFLEIPPNSPPLIPLWAIKGRIFGSTPFIYIFLSIYLSISPYLPLSH